MKCAAKRPNDGTLRNDGNIIALQNQPMSLRYETAEKYRTGTGQDIAYKDMMNDDDGLIIVKI